MSIALAENVQRDDLNPLQEARAYQQLMATGISVADVCRQVGVPPFRVNSRLTLLRLDPAVQLLFARNQLPLMMAGVLVRIGDANRQRQLALMAERRRLTVKQLQAVINRAETKPDAKPIKANPSHRVGRKTNGSKVRQNALDRLESSKRTLTRELVFAAVNECCAIDCKMLNETEICDACPVPSLVRRLA